MEALRRLDHVGVALGVGLGAASVLACNASAGSGLEDFVHTGKKVRCACVLRKRTADSRIQYVSAHIFSDRGCR